MTPATIDPETTWQERPETRGWHGTGDGYTVDVDDDSFTLNVGGQMYERGGFVSTSDAITEARDVRRLVMGVRT